MMHCTPQAHSPQRRCRHSVIVRQLKESGTPSPARGKLHWFLQSCEPLFKELQHPKCFISYCWGPQADRPRLQGQLKALKRELGMLGAKIILDLNDLDSDINSFMSEHLTQSNFVFLIGTPALKARLEATEPNNLKTEFSEITKKMTRHPNCLLPLIFQGEGSFEQAFQTTLPINFIRQHNILVRDCRQFGDEWQNPAVLDTYIDTQSMAVIEMEQAWASSLFCIDSYSQHIGW